MKRIVVFLFLVTIALHSRPATFVVTSNADAGAGTLREAIIAANANGTAEVDYIHFNISGAARADVSISLATELPVLTSKIIIDGTTQPTALLGNANIKVAIVRGGTDFFSGLRLDNASEIEIYGLSFSNFKSDPLGAVDENKAGIYLYNSKNIIIGAPLKPNCFNNNFAGILSPFVIPRFDNVNIKITSNIFGLGENGLLSQPNQAGIDISFLTDGSIGGDLVDEGNLFGSNTRVGIALGGAATGIKITNNRIGLNINSLLVKSTSATGIIINGETAAPLIKNNIIGGQLVGIYLDYVNGGFKLEGNDIGTNQLGTFDFGNATGVHVRFCNKGMIGGDDLSQGNNIAYNATGVLLEIAYPISMLKNSFYCNSAAITFKNLPEGKSIAQSRIQQISSNAVSGTFVSYGKVELFYTDSCPDCQGKTWFATVLADVNGNWNYSGPVTGKVTCMGTNTDGATSTFSKPLIISASAAIAGVVCGETTGSISVPVYDASVFEWYNAANVLVGRDRVLTGVGAGNYYLKAGQLGACDVTSAVFTIDGSSNGINDSQKVIVNEYCGSGDGSITKIIVANNLTRIWYNASNEVVSTADDLIGVKEGIYYFRAGTGNCEVRSNNYTVGNTIITYKARTVNQIPETCGNKNGSVTITAYETEKPNRFEWFDEQGNLVSDQENLKDYPAGKYKLIGYGDTGCENTVGEFEILTSQSPTIDYSSFRQYISCDGKTISTTGLIINGTSSPYTFKWQDEDGNTVSTLLNISGVEKGKYTLFVTDKNDCVVNGETIDFSQLISSALEVPNAISPNGDGVNDYWEIKGVQNYPLGDFSIFARDGSRVFYSKGYAKPFNGFFNGKTLPTGVYYYVIDLKTSCGVQSGSLTILR
ncbi:MAG: gliding motility-associated C-terminal domain-containing protein [Pedobacter sp.]|nr:MAG: gliding motility-associated C-terminal domain-containing protein [Pedobacter sp.]